MEDYFSQIVRTWRSVTSRTVREAVAVLLLLIVIFGAGFSALTTYANLVVYDEDRFVEELDGIFEDEDVHLVVSKTFTDSAVGMADLPTTPAGASGAEQLINEEMPAIVSDLLTNSVNDGLLEQAVRGTHRDVLAVVGGTAVANPPALTVEVDLGPIFNQALASITENEDLAFLSNVTPPENAGVVTVLERTTPGDRFWEFLGQLSDRRSSTITLIVLCGVAALLLSPSRPRIVWSIGTGLIVMSAILAVGIYGSRALLAVLIDNTDTVGTAQAIHEALISDLSGRLVNMALFGVLMVVVGAAIGWAWRRYGPTLPEEEAVAVAQTTPQ